ncbi:hypothetical protein L7F22_003365 [Adiantum nelumboides]|nr:hypothetical protein [Adiantum nelumboides]
MINDAVQQSQKLIEELAGVETLSQSLLAHEQHAETQLKSILGFVQAAYNVSDNMKTQQKELHQLGQEMHKAISTDMQELQKAALHTAQQLLDTSEGYEQLADQQVQLADSFVDKVQHLKDSALQSLNELKELKTFAMAETRETLGDLFEGAQKAEASMHLLRTKMDNTYDIYLQSSHAILQAQEAFVAKQGSILFTLDRIFSLYDSSLFESRALKMLLFYGMSLVFVHVLTSAKQTNNARAQLYSGLFISIAVELYIMKASGGSLQSQQWIQTCSYWIRGIFGIFTVTLTVYCMVTYRDLSSHNHELLLQLYRKLSDLANKPHKEPYHLGGDKHSWPFSLQFTATVKSLSQVMFHKILHRALKSVWRRRGKSKISKNDALKDWMASHGLDITLQLMDESSFDDDDDSDYYCPEPDMDNNAYSHYNLRSLCNQRAMCHFHTRRLK